MAFCPGFLLTYKQDRRERQREGERQVCEKKTEGLTEKDKKKNTSLRKREREREREREKERQGWERER